MADGYRESTQSQWELLLDLQRRGLVHAPDLVIVDAALGFWNASREVLGATYGLNYDKAVEKLAKDRDVLLTFDDFPAEHWKDI